MLNWSISFFVLSIFAAIFAFGGIGMESAYFPKILSFVFMVFFMISLLGVGRERAS